MFKYILPVEFSDVIEVIEIELTKEGKTEEVLKLTDNRTAKIGDFNFNCVRLAEKSKDNYYPIYLYKKETNGIGITKYTFVKTGKTIYIPEK